MLRTDPAAELEFYSYIRSLNLPPATRIEAILFARAFADLAKRVLAARSAQAGLAYQFPPLLALPALKAWLSGPAEFAEQFSRSAPGSWGRETTALLAALASWLSSVYDVARPVSGSYQVWTDVPGSTALRLYGPPASPKPPAPFVLLDAPPIAAVLAADRERRHALIAHYDVHGLSMLALTQRFFDGCSVTGVDAALSFEWTGDISKLWKRAVPKTIQHERQYGTVVMIDCSVHSRKPEYTLKAVARLKDTPRTSLYVVDHHDDTLLAATDLVAAGVNVVLTDILSCGLTMRYDEVELELMYLGALGDKAPEALAAGNGERLERIGEANREFHRWMINFSPTPKHFTDQGSYPLQPLWEKLAAGERVSAALTAGSLGVLRPAAPEETPSFARCGELLLITGRLKTVGRTWYSLLEQLMEQEHCAYAGALRILDGRRANLLLLNQWKLIDYPPVLSFVPEHYLSHCLGHPSAVWTDLDIGEALPFLDSVARNLNRYLGTEQGLGAVAGLLEQNIIRPA